MHEDPAYLRSALAGRGLRLPVEEGGGFGADCSHPGGRSRRDLRGPAPGGRARPGRVGEESPRTDPKRPVRILSDRELQVLKLVALGYTSAQIAQRIHVGVKTVETYRSRVAAKLGLRTRRDVIRFAMQMGLLAQDTPEGHPDSSAQ